MPPAFCMLWILGPASGALPSGFEQLVGEDRGHASPPRRKPGTKPWRSRKFSPEASAIPADPCGIVALETSFFRGRASGPNPASERDRDKNRSSEILSVSGSSRHAGSTREVNCPMHALVSSSLLVGPILRVA